MVYIPRAATSPWPATHMTLEAYPTPSLVYDDEQPATTDASHAIRNSRSQITAAIIGGSLACGLLLIAALFMLFYIAKGKLIHLSRRHTSKPREKPLPPIPRESRNSPASRTPGYTRVSQRAQQPPANESCKKPKGVFTLKPPKEGRDKGDIGRPIQSPTRLYPPRPPRPQRPDVSILPRRPQVPKIETQKHVLFSVPEQSELSTRQDTELPRSGWSNSTPNETPNTAVTSRSIIIKLSSDIWKSMQGSESAASRGGVLSSGEGSARTPHDLRASWSFSPRHTSQSPNTSRKSKHGLKSVVEDQGEQDLGQRWSSLGGLLYQDTTRSPKPETYSPGSVDIGEPLPGKYFER